MISVTGPQAFYPITKNLTIYPNDFLAARCTYSTTNFENGMFLSLTTLLTGGQPQVSCTF